MHLPPLAFRSRAANAASAASAARRTLASASLLLALGAVVAGCGSSHTTASSADPASAVPASASIYAGATVRPTGALKSAALTAGRALTHEANPYLRLLGALQTPGSPKLSFARDVAPWLGADAGVFLSSASSAGPLTSLLEQGLLGGSASSSGFFPFSSSGAQGALVLDTSDAAKARRFLEGQARHAGAHAASYRGVAFQLSSAGVAFGLVDRMAVIGSEAGMHAVIETTQGGPSLAHTSGYAKLLASAPSQALAHVYTNPSALKASGGGEGLAGLLGVLAGSHEADISLVPQASSVALDADTLASTASSGGLLASGSEGAAALSELPGESWLAVGLGHLSSTLGPDVQALKSLISLEGAPSVAAPETTATLSVKSLLGAVLSPLSVLGGSSAQARRDYASWMGSAGIFASGASLLELKAAVVIASSDPALSRAAVGKLATALSSSGGSIRSVSIPGTEAASGVSLPGLPVVLDLADGRDAAGQSKFVLGLGEASVEAALRPSSTLAASATHTAAGAALGEGIQPSVMLDVPTLLSLLEGIGLTDEPTLSKLLPYLRSATTVAAGGHQLPTGAQRLRLVLGLQAGG